MYIGAPGGIRYLVLRHDANGSAPSWPCTPRTVSARAFQKSLEPGEHESRATEAGQVTAALVDQTSPSAFLVALAGAYLLLRRREPFEPLQPGHGLVQRREHRIERMLDHAGVAPQCPGGDLGRLNEDDGRAALSRKGGRRATDDPAANDEQIRMRHGSSA